MGEPFKGGVLQAAWEVARKPLKTRIPFKIRVAILMALMAEGQEVVMLYYLTSLPETEIALAKLLLQIRTISRIRMEEEEGRIRKIFPFKTLLRSQVTNRVNSLCIKQL